MERPIQVLLVDDHAVVRQGLRAVLESKPDIRIVGEAADGYEAVERALALDPDVILMDLVMPRKDGISAMHDILERRPDARILVLSSFSDDTQVAESIRVGAMGYQLKTTDTDELAEAIRQVHAGEMPLHPLVARRVIATLMPKKDEPRLADVLTRRELELLPLVVRGLKNREIADRLSISPRTVGTHIGNMIRKTEVKNRIQLSRLAVLQGLSSYYQDE